MVLLKTEPPQPVRSLRGFFAVAHRLERDAADHYAGLSARMRDAGSADAAAVFERLAEDKRGRALDVERWSKERTGAAPDPAGAGWKPKDMFGEEMADDDMPPRLATAYRALSLAVEHQERAFVFWSYVVAQAEDPAVRQTAAALAEEELHRAAALRRERRLAFHAQRRAPHKTGERHVSSDEPPGGSPREAVPLERELAVRLQELAAASAARGDEGEAHSLHQMAEESEKLAQEVADANTLAAAAGQVPSDPADPHDGGDTPLRAALRLAELAVERYLAAAEAAKDEAGMLKAQSLAERAIARSARLGRISG